ncbi:MAG TPA: GlsB/YeaQ/YmgE family stress response membrane protein [Acidimicrobiales bacterium]|nr:GlsB/YeaQ/YmgE family stress response membrane protein [Acidimicrobiales bacterium]
MGLVVLLVIGLVAGAIARFLVPGRDNLGLIGTLLLGIIGSFVGGMLAVALTDRTMDDFGGSGLFGSIIGAVVALVAYRLMQPRGRLTGRPGTRI